MFLLVYQFVSFLVPFPSCNFLYTASTCLPLLPLPWPLSLLIFVAFFFSHIIFYKYFVFLDFSLFFNIYIFSDICFVVKSYTFGPIILAVISLTFILNFCFYKIFYLQGQYFITCCFCCYSWNHQALCFYIPFNLY